MTSLRDSRWEEFKKSPEKKSRYKILYKFNRKYLRMMEAFYIPETDTFRLLDNRTHIQTENVELYMKLE